MKLLLTAEIDADTESEAQEKLDQLREHLARFGPRVYDDISLFRAHRVEVRDALTSDPEFSKDSFYSGAEDYEKVPTWDTKRTKSTK